jgi:hypothetical protein
VKVTEVDLNKDLLRVEYDPKKSTPRAMLEEVGRQGFVGEVVPER